MSASFGSDALQEGELTSYTGPSGHGVSSHLKQRVTQGDQKQGFPMLPLPSAIRGRGLEPAGETPAGRRFSRDFSGTFSSVRGTFQGRSGVQMGKAVIELEEEKPLIRCGLLSTR